MAPKNRCPTCGQFKLESGMYVTKKGYLRISAGPHRGRYVHELVAEAMLGRKLNPDEQVHHRGIDDPHNKLNPEWANLQILGEKEHGAISRSQAWYFSEHEIKGKAEWDNYFDKQQPVVDQVVESKDSINGSMEKERDDERTD